MGIYFCVEGVWARKAKHSFKNYPKGERLVQTQSREEVPGHWEARLSFLSALKAFGMASAHLKGSSQAGEEMPTEEKPLLATLCAWRITLHTQSQQALRTSRSGSGYCPLSLPQQQEPSLRIQHTPATDHHSGGLGKPVTFFCASVSSLVEQGSLPSSLLFVMLAGSYSAW